ncbi:Babam2 [Phodopus roborovskii]|uniref:BRISC and BRCA1-A complex member 2 n=1 Tax=Phodopus roborovskii TaxID=109678 RepID=A0AAU9Z2J5_PHORO|nr:Babam2 [Phodopus roborovskii]
MPLGASYPSVAPQSSPTCDFEPCCDVLVIHLFGKMMPLNFASSSKHPFHPSPRFSPRPHHTHNRYQEWSVSHIQNQTNLVLMSVAYQGIGCYACCQFSSSQQSEDALGGSSALHIPAFPGGGCLIDYVPQVCHLLTNKVQYVIQGYHKRREYIAAFLSHFGTGVVEYDAEGFTKLTLLLMWKDFCFLVHIGLLYIPNSPSWWFSTLKSYINERSSLGALPTTPCSNH